MIRETCNLMLMVMENQKWQRSLSKERNFKEEKMLIASQLVKCEIVS